MIPNWFDDTYHHAAVELGDARHALDEQHREDVRIERRIHDLTDDLNQLQPECEPRSAAALLDRRNQLRNERDPLRQHATTNRRFLRLLDDHETTVADAQQTVDALDTWKRRATGHKVPLEQLVEAVDVLHSDRAIVPMRRAARLRLTPSRVRNDAASVLTRHAG